MVLPEVSQNMPVSTLIVSARGRGRRHEILSHEKLYDCLRLLFFCIHRSTKVKDFKNHPAAYMCVSSKMMGKPRGGPRNYDYNNAHRNVFISSSKECRASLLR